MTQLLDSGTLPGMATTTGLVVVAIIIVVALGAHAWHNHWLHNRTRRDLKKRGGGV